MRRSLVGVVALSVLTGLTTVGVLGGAAPAGATTGLNTGVVVATSAAPPPTSPNDTVYPVISFYGTLTIDGNPLVAAFQVTNIDIPYHGVDVGVPLQGSALNGPSFSGTCTASNFAFSVTQPNVTLQCHVGFTTPTTDVTLGVYILPGLPQPQLTTSPGLYTDLTLPIPPII